ncbi:MAG TPA: hypothetical protein VK661_00415 [Planctomycetota bacterium]|nr:hypothetical protein [Planctomycetota bacterium]
MVWLLGAVALALVVVLAERIFVAPEDQLTPEDVLALPYRKIRLIARLERYVLRFVDPPLRGVEIEFFDGERPLGSAVTDAQGSAAIEIDSGPAGLRRLRVASSRAEEPLVVRVLPADAPVLVVDLDHTIADVSPFRFAFMDNRSVRPVLGAVDAVLRLGERFTVVYLTARDHSFLGKTREWLRLVGLPDGPVFLRRRRFWSQRPIEHKLERLGELARDHRLVAGVGDLPDDAKAYLATGLKAFLLDPRGIHPDVEGVVRVPSWKELEERLGPTFVPPAR